MNTTVITGTRGPAARGPQAPPRRTARPTRPATRPPGGARPASRAAGSTSAAVRRPVSRTPFILLVLALLGGGLVCLLVINTTLAAASFRISNLQRENAQATQQVQELQQQVSTDQSANAIKQRALRLGLREQPTLNFVDLQAGRRYTTPTRVQGVYAVPGYTP
jgi:hypothetical protein